MSNDFKQAIMKEFEMKYLGLMQYFLSEEVLQGDEKAFIC